MTFSCHSFHLSQLLGKHAFGNGPRHVQVQREIHLCDHVICDLVLHFNKQSLTVCIYPTDMLLKLALEPHEHLEEQLLDTENPTIDFVVDPKSLFDLINAIKSVSA